MEQVTRQFSKVVDEQINLENKNDVKLDANSTSKVEDMEKIPPLGYSGF